MWEKWHRLTCAKSNAVSSSSSSSGSVAFFHILSAKNAIPHTNDWDATEIVYHVYSLLYITLNKREIAISLWFVLYVFIFSHPTRNKWRSVSLSHTEHKCVQSAAIASSINMWYFPVSNKNKCEIMRTRFQTIFTGVLKKNRRTKIKIYSH